MWPLRAIAFLLLFFGLSTVSLVVPVLGAAHYMLIYQVFPEHTWWYQPIAPLGLRFSMTAALCMMFGMLLNVSRMPSVRPMFSAWDVGAFGMVMAVLGAEFTAEFQSPDAGYLTDKFIKIMIFVFCLTRITTTKRNFTIVMWSLVLGSLYIGYDAWTAPRGAFGQGRLEVIGGPDFRHSSGLAAHMGAMIPLIAATLLSTRAWTLRAVTLISGALTINTVVLCRTRSAFVGLACGAVAAILMAPKKRRIRIYLAMIILVPCAFRLTDKHFWTRMSTLTDRQALEQDPAATGRLEIWKAARSLIARHPLGVGVGNFQYRVHEVTPGLGQRAAHNSFILCWAELGLQGIFIFVCLIGVSLGQTWHCYRDAYKTFDPVWTRFMAYGLMLSIVISLGTQMFTERFYTEAFWWILALPGCLQRVVIRESAQRSVPIEKDRFVNLDSWHNENPLLPDGHARGAFA